MAYKIEKLCRKIQKDIAEIIRTEMNDPRMGFASITRVELTRDLKYAKVYVSILGKPSEQAKVMMGLEHARGFIQGHVARRLQTRQTPILEFEEDFGIEESIRISKLLRGLAEERGDPEDGAEADPDPDPNPDTNPDTGSEVDPDLDTGTYGEKPGPEPS